MFLCVSAFVCEGVSVCVCWSRRVSGGFGVREWVSVCVRVFVVACVRVCVRVRWCASLCFGVAFFSHFVCAWVSFASLPVLVFAQVFHAFVRIELLFL